jgi:hypothetical protein
MPELTIREATLRDESELLRMMRLIDEQAPALIKFDESALRAAFRQFLTLPALEECGYSAKGTKPWVTLCWRWGSASNSADTMHL